MISLEQITSNLDEKVIYHYLKQFSKLRRDYKFGGAPHKPILLLAIIQLIEKEEINSNYIEITPELVLEFKEIWSKLVETPHLCNFSLPFYHLKSEPFWKLITKNGIEIPTTSSNSIKSLSSLQENLSYAQLDYELFHLLQNKEIRLIFTQALLDQYFENTKNNFYQSKEIDLFTQLENQILTESKNEYSERIEILKNKLSKEEFQEEIFVRGGVFKREIPKIYNYQCAISEMKIESTRNIQMIDACHIVPFAFSKNDTITNGISLSPNLHRAFDRGLITINNDYTVVVTSKIIESKSAYSISQFEGKKILLPQNSNYYPNPENLKWHRQERFIL